MGVDNPNRSISKNHRFAPVRRRGTERNPGSAPPRAAERRAASLAIKAFSPARADAVVFQILVRRRACLIRF
jgi:hypothetical protein